MGRRKIAIAPIEDDRNRSVTFFKRKAGLLKKAHELSVLCQVDVALVIRVKDNKYYEYSSKDIDEILQNYSKDEVIDSKRPEDFVEPPRRPRSSRHTRNQSSTSQISMSEDQSDSMDEDDQHEEVTWSSQAQAGRKTHERQASTNSRRSKEGTDRSPMLSTAQSPANKHTRGRSSSATPSQNLKARRPPGDAILRSPMTSLQTQQTLSSPMLVQQQFDLAHPQTGAKMPPQVAVKLEPHQLPPEQQGQLQNPPTPSVQQLGMPFHPQPPPPQQPRQFQYSTGPAIGQPAMAPRMGQPPGGQIFRDMPLPAFGGGARPKLKVEIPKDAAERAAGAGNWPDHSLSPSGYLLSSQVVSEPASRLPLGNGEKTPLSASLPSRYLNDMLPSPSNMLFTNDWGVPWSGIPDSAGARRQGQPGFATVPPGVMPSAGAQTPSMGLPSALSGLTPGGLNATARGIAGDAVAAMQAATQQSQQQQIRLQQQLMQHSQPGQLHTQVLQSPTRLDASESLDAPREDIQPAKRHKTG